MLQHFTIITRERNEVFNLWLNQNLKTIKLVKHSDYKERLIDWEIKKYTLNQNYGVFKRLYSCKPGKFLITEKIIVNPEKAKVNPNLVTCLIKSNK